VGLLALQAHAATSGYLIQDLASQDSVTLVSVDQIAQRVKVSNLISLGETHESGPEKKVLSFLANAIFSNIRSKPTCIVETYELLVRPENEINSLYQNNCNTIADLQGNGPSSTTFSNALKAEFASDFSVVTHSGFRHILPWGKIYPQDFNSVIIDIIKNNTISTQLPDAFLKQNKKMTSVAAVPLDQLYMNLLRVTR
jgi:hypothetical protein